MHNLEEFFGYLAHCFVSVPIGQKTFYLVFHGGGGQGAAGTVVAQPWQSVLFLSPIIIRTMHGESSLRIGSPRIRAHITHHNKRYSRQDTTFNMQLCPHHALFLACDMCGAQDGFDRDLFFSGCVLKFHPVLIHAARFICASPELPGSSFCRCTLTS